MGWRLASRAICPKISPKAPKIHKRDDYPPIVGRLCGQEDHEEKRSKDRAAVTPAVTRSTIRAEGVAIVPQTISRHLAEANLKSKHPFRALPLTPEHRQLRLQWCQAKSMWNVTDWQNFVLTDECLFVLGTDDNRVRVWRHPGPFLNGLPGAIFQQDNAHRHTARVAQDFLRHFQALPWPARSPDLSPVEHVWDQLKRQMPSCHSVHDLEFAVQDLWAHLPQDNIRCLINSMPDRVAACIAAGGGPTRYRSCPVFVSLHTLYSFNCLVFEINRLTATGGPRVGHPWSREAAPIEFRICTFISITFTECAEKNDAFLNDRRGKISRDIIPIPRPLCTIIFRCTFGEKDFGQRWNRLLLCIKKRLMRFAFHAED
ncbi:transposable element Tcb2 transposase [Trichonephila clavipes]|nr:transposable element Tcb2 transposase [Trichonephila clavipes]